jgi:Tfp pilus assembly protein PilV
MSNRALPARRFRERASVRPGDFSVAHRHGRAFRCAQEGGGSLLEVLVALALVAITIAAAVASQLRVGQAQRAAARREEATMIAASIAAAMRDPSSGLHALPHWQAVAASALPQAHVSIVDHAPGIALAVVGWAEPLDSPSSQAPSARIDCANASEREQPGAACSAVPFVR